MKFSISYFVKIGEMELVVDAFEMLAKVQSAHAQFVDHLHDCIHSRNPVYEASNIPVLDIQSVLNRQSRGEAEEGEEQCTR